jgi:hypothetical protein
MERAASEEIRKACGFVDGAFPENDDVVRFGSKPGERVPSQFRDSLLEGWLSAIEIRGEERHVSVRKTGAPRGPLSAGILSPIALASTSSRCNTLLPLSLRKTTPGCPRKRLENSSITALEMTELGPCQLSGFPVWKRHHHPTGGCNGSFSN